MANESKDQPVRGHIDCLVKEEERLYARSALTDDDRDRLAKIKVELDQCWDLLRQRRALREFGRDPDQAKVRPPKVVETTSSSPGPQVRATDRGIVCNKDCERPQQTTCNFSKSKEIPATSEPQRLGSAQAELIVQ
jgi:hypothetical protein